MKVERMKLNDKRYETRKCANGECEREISYGEDVIFLGRTVIGSHGPVSLPEGVKYFDTSTCLREYVCDSNGPELPKRIP